MEVIIFWCVRRRTNLSWRRHGRPPAQPPCRWTAPLSRSSPPRKMLSYTFLMLPHFNLKSRLPTSPGIQTQCLEQRERWLPHDVIIRAIFAEPFHFEVAWQFPLLSCFHIILVHRDWNCSYFQLFAPSKTKHGLNGNTEENDPNASNGKLFPKQWDWSLFRQQNIFSETNQKTQLACYSKPMSWRATWHKPPLPFHLSEIVLRGFVF